MTEFTAIAIGLVLLIASLTAMISRRLKLPYSVGLVLGGIVLSLLPAGITLPLTRELIFSVFLPPLIFEAALHLKWDAFRRDLALNASLAFPGVAVAAACVAAGMHFLVGWGWSGAAMFGVLIAATDPVAVIAAFKESKVDPRLSMTVETESLLNDGAAAVGFTLIGTIAAGSAISPGSVAWSFIWTVSGGIAAGAAVAGPLLLLAWRTEDHLVEITLTTIAAYGSFLLAEHFGMSGVLASMTAGLVVGNLGWKYALSEGGRGYVLAFWDYAAFLANSVVFILIGGHEAHQPIALFGGAAAVAVVLVLLGRAIAIYPICGLFSRSSLALDRRFQHVLVWGGLRGALALALALALPEDLPQRAEMIVVAFAVVAFSIFVQGLTMPWLLRRLGLLLDGPG